MLVIGRKVGESFLIGENVEVCILEVDNGVVKVGINAPKTIKIVRKELIAEIKSENLESIKNIENIIKKIK